MRWPTLPIAVLVRLHLVEVGVFAYDRRFIHAVFVAQVGEGGQMRGLSLIFIGRVSGPLGF
jgi:hypothetical protein